jgi:methyl-accepting chemotaxis protein
MKHGKIEAESGLLDQTVATDCGEMAVGCAEAAGQIEGATRHMQAQLSELHELDSVVDTLEQDQRAIADSTDEAKLLSAQACEKLDDGSARINEAVGEFRSVIGLVSRLGVHVTDFAAVMEQVQQVTKSIEAIAKTTNMLALNAAIEAARAGEAGKTFAVVASEVKALARNSSAAAEEIRTTIGKLVGEASGLVNEIQAGVDQSSRAEHELETVTLALSDATRLVAMLDEQSDRIAMSAATVHSKGMQVREAVGRVVTSVRGNATMLDETRSSILSMETTSNKLYNAVIAAGISPLDTDFIELAKKASLEISEAIEAALSSGALTDAQLYDESYIEIPGSNPPRFRTGLTTWADANLRPIYDRVFHSNAMVRSCSAHDMRGFMPTHMTDQSRVPTGDLVHDTKYCRNGRMLWDTAMQQAKASTAPYYLMVHRHEHDGAQYMVVRSVYVPIRINGRRWGDFGMAYQL